MSKTQRPLKTQVRTARFVRRFRNQYQTFAGSVEYSERANEIISIACDSLDRKEKSRLLKILAQELGAQRDSAPKELKNAITDGKDTKSAHINLSSLPRALTVPDGKIPFIPAFVGRNTDAN